MPEYFERLRPIIIIYWWHNFLKVTIPELRNLTEVTGFKNSVQNNSY